MAYRIFKVLHILALAAFLGSIFGHIVSSVLGGAVGGTPAFLAAREHIAFATKVLTMPGLYALLATGLAMVASGRLNPLRQRWLLIHGALGAAILVLALLVIQPAVAAAGSGSEALMRGAGDVAKVAAAKQAEDGIGALNMLLAVAAIVLAVFKPGSAKLSD